MDPFGYDADQYAAAAGWASVLVLVATGIVIVLQLRHAQGLRRDQSRPHVVPSIITDGFQFMLQIENVGATPAHKVRFEFRPPLTSKRERIETLRMFAEGIPTMPPGQRFRADWESSLTVFSEEEPYDLPIVYDVRVSYEDRTGRRYADEQYFLDFRIFQGQPINDKAMPDLVRAVEELTRLHRSWTDGARGLAVHNTDADRRNRRELRSIHLDQSKRLLDQNGWRAVVKFWIEHWAWQLGLRR